MFEQVTNSEDTQSATTKQGTTTNRTSDRAGERTGGQLHDALWGRICVYLIFFLSGAAALIYEISWTRQIGLLFGHTIHAASIVLASYFAGMSFGYWIGAKWSSRVSSLLGYAIAEMVVVVWAFAIPMILEASQSSELAPLLSSSSIAWQTTTRAVFSFLLLLPATISLGVTLPMIANYFATQPNIAGGESSSASIAWAYALNTGGAFAGASLATFYMLAVVGVRSSSYAAAALSALCAVVAIIVSRRVDGSPRETDKRNLQPANLAHRPIRLRSFALASLSGFAILGLQVLYTRMFSLVFHNSTYTFGIVVLVFLASLSVGAAAAAQLQKRFPPKQLVGVALGMGALAVTLSVPIFVCLTDLKYFSFGDSFLQYLTGAIVLVTVIVAPAIICLGMLLPLVWVMAGGSETNGQIVGKLTAVNTFAAAIGAVLVSFFLLIWAGLWASFVLISILLMVAGASLLWKKQHKKRNVLSVLIFGISCGLALFSPTESKHDSIEFDETIVKRWNSSYGWIDVVQRGRFDVYKVRQNLHYRFGSTADDLREFRQAHIPLSLHRDPQDVLFLGLGTGLTAGGAVSYPGVGSIVAVELIPEVVEAARMLADHNFNVVDHPKVEIKVDDARHYLYASPRFFDVIVSDLFVPWESESGYLYTIEHYRIASERLKPGGLFCQWLPLYQLGPEEFESIANSFAGVFPNTTIWWGQLESGSPVVALVGTQSPLEVDASKLETRIAELASQVGAADESIANADRFWDLYIGDWKLTSRTNFNTDEHPRVEFLTPISNRNGKLMRGEELEQYYNEVLSKLPNNSAQLYSQKALATRTQRRARQRLILFGN